jgi:CheY-like chemotaxis protein
MLPSGAYADPLPPFSSGARAEPTANDAHPALIVAVAPADVERFSVDQFVRFVARNTADAIKLMERWRPRVVVVDWDVPDFDGRHICEAAQQMRGTGVLVTTAVPDHAPAALKAGCHALLLKPLNTNLIAARLGRLSRELPAATLIRGISEKLGHGGTNRTWPEMACPQCAQTGTVGFEYASHRRTWYACLSCDSVWVGTRQE